MKRILGCILVCLLCASCVGKLNETPVSTLTPTPVPTPAPTPIVTPTPQPAREFWMLSDGVALQLDLDGDGQEDTVTVRTLSEEWNDYVELQVNDNAIAVVEYGYLTSAAVYRIGDAYGIYVGIDYASADYELMLYKVKDGEPVFVRSAAHARITMLAEDEMVLECYMDVLGTWRSETRYRIEENFALTALEMAQLKPEQELETKAPFTVQVDGEDVTLPVGSKIVPTACEDSEQGGLFCFTWEGKAGSLAYTREEWRIYIDGVDAETLFVLLPYAG